MVRERERESTSTGHAFRNSSRSLPPTRGPLSLLPFSAFSFLPPVRGVRLRSLHVRFAFFFPFSRSPPYSSLLSLFFARMMAKRGRGSRRSTLDTTRILPSVCLFFFFSFFFCFFSFFLSFYLIPILLFHSFLYFFLSFFLSFFLLRRLYYLVERLFSLTIRRVFSRVF